MRAVFIDAPGEVRVGELPDAHCGPEEVLLQVRRIGLCGTDLNTYRGRNPLVAYPRVPGHELAATVIEVGGEAQGPAVGEWVTVVPYTSCGLCTACRKNRPNACRSNQTLGVQRDGALCERLAVPADKVLTAGGLSPEALALVEPLAIGSHAAARARVSSADTVAVLGCGAVGLGIVAAAHRRSARVLAVDLDPGKLELATAAGADKVVDGREGDVVKQLSALTEGDGPEVVIEAVGTPETFVAAVEAVCHGGRVVYVGYAGQPVAYETKQFILKELDIFGSRNATRGDFQESIKLLASGSFPVDQAVTETVALDQTGAALARWHEDPARVTRIQVTVE